MHFFYLWGKFYARLVLVNVCQHFCPQSKITEVWCNSWCISAQTLKLSSNYFQISNQCMTRSSCVFFCECVCVWLRIRFCCFSEGWVWSVCVREGSGRSACILLPGGFLSTRTFVVMHLSCRLAVCDFLISFNHRKASQAWMVPQIMCVVEESVLLLEVSDALFSPAGPENKWKTPDWAWDSIKLKSWKDIVCSYQHFFTMC